MSWKDAFTQRGLLIDTDYWFRVEPVVGGVEVRAKCRGTAQREATVFLAEEDWPRVVLFRRGFNARTPATIDGPAVAWSYADGHGMEIVAILRRGQSFTLWLPGHHGHGPGQKFAGTVSDDGTVTLTPLPTARRISL